jgi:hypothetical protein
MRTIGHMHPRKKLTIDHPMNEQARPEKPFSWSIPLCIPENATATHSQKLPDRLQTHMKTSIVSQRLAICRASTLDSHHRTSTISDIPRNGNTGSVTTNMDIGIDTGQTSAY